MIDRIREWYRCVNKVEFVVFSGIGLFILFTVFVIHACIVQDNQAYEHFMTDCMKDHKEYECTAMWRAGRIRE